MMNRPEDADEVAAALLHTCSDHRVFTFRGDLGAGKTTLIKALCRELGVEENTSSPSFAIVNEYHDLNHEPVYHFDLYRLKDVSELQGIGLEEYLDSGHYCFVEWPELAAGKLPPGTVRIDMRAVDGERILHIDVSPLPTPKATMA